MTPSSHNATALPSAVDLIKQAWDVMTTHSQLIFKIILLIYIPINTILFLQTSQYAEAEADWGMFADTIRFSNSLETFLGVIATIAVIYITYRHHQGARQGQISVDDIKKIVKERYVSVFITNIALGFLLVLATLLFVIPGIYFGVAWAFTIQVVVLAGKRGWDALKHSKSLIGPRWWFSLGYFFVIFMVGVGIVALYMLLTAFIPDQLQAISIVTDTIFDFMYLLPIIALTLMYLEFEEAFGGDDEVIAE